MKALVTGATGFVGAAVVQALLRHGHAVVGLVRDPAKGEALARAGVELAAPLSHVCRGPARSAAVAGTGEGLNEHFPLS
jgi:nucleoside-diphosphate-sugar epimerase